MVPHWVETQPMPEALQVTLWFVVPVTVAVYCCCAPVPTCTPSGETDTAILDCEAMVTVADPETVGMNNNVAVTATTGGLGAVAGAVYRPELLTLPQANPLQLLPETLQITIV
jgi:hypothetical protein